MVVAADVQTMIDAPTKRVQWTVLVNGIVTACTEATVRHAVKNPIGSCTLTLPAPLPAHVTERAAVEVQAGYPGQIATIFRGTVMQDSITVSPRGRSASLKAVSLGSRMAGKDYTDVVYQGPISLRDLFQAMAKRRQLAAYYSDDTTTTLGATITLGNNEQANDKSVTVPRKQSNLDFLNGIANLFGYYVFDTPAGMRQKRVSGIPTADAAITVTEAWNAVQVGRERDTTGIVNYWEVFGARYTDVGGNTIVLRSIPATVPYDARLAPTGYARDERSSELLDLLGLCDRVRNVLEIDHSEPYVLVPWETHGAPHLMPGDVAHVTSGTAAIDGLQWVMTVEHTINAGGFRTFCEGWRGAGVPLARGEDCITTAIPGGPWHIGDETVPWYAVPAPNGTTFSVPFTVLEHYTMILIRGKAHGTNSQLRDGVNTDLDVSRFEIHQHGEKVSEGTLPVLPEDFAARRDYTNDANWSDIFVPMSGTLEPGPATLVFHAGDGDDYEVKSLSMRTCGVGSAVIGREVA